MLKRLELTAYDLSLVVVVLQTFILYLITVYDKTKGSSARTFVRGRAPFLPHKTYCEVGGGLPGSRKKDVHSAA